MRFRIFVTVCTLAVACAVSDEAGAQDGEAAFQANCATCHVEADTAENLNVPSVEALRAYTSEAILNSLLNGRMRIEGTPLTEADRRAVAQFLGGRPLRERSAGSSVVRCTTSPSFPGAGAADGWNGWGNGIGNTRFAPNGGLSAADLPRLKLKWAFGFADVTSARAQPALVGDRLFVASDSGEVHALDPETGCAYWSFLAQATVRTGLFVAPYAVPDGGAGWAVFFGDLRANAYALDATSGRSIWTRKLDEHPLAAITGTIVYHDGRVLVPVQGLNEEVQGGRPEYECCTFRGSLSALGAGRGGQWGSAVDARQAYFGVADFGTSAPGGMVAVDLATGERVWHRPAQELLCGTPSRACSAAQGAAVTAIPGAVLSGSLDGGLRAYAADDGALLWQLDTNREFTTVNGVKANGGSMDAAGPTVAGGLLFVNSGYGGTVSRPGNVLLVFGVD